MQFIFGEPKIFGIENLALKDGVLNPLQISARFSIIRLSEILSRSIENHLEDREIYDRSFDILIKNFVDFYMTLEKRYGRLSFRELYENEPKFDYERLLEKLTIMNITNTPMAQNIFSLAEDITKKFRQAGVNDSMILDELYTQTLSNCLLLYDALKK